jgi:hypothetical protein
LGVIFNPKKPIASSSPEVSSFCFFPQKELGFFNEIFFPSKPPPPPPQELGFFNHHLTIFSFFYPQKNWDFPTTISSFFLAPKRTGIFQPQFLPFRFYLFCSDKNSLKCENSSLEKIFTQQFLFPYSIKGGEEGALRKWYLDFGTSR